MPTGVACGKFRQCLTERKSAVGGSFFGNGCKEGVGDLCQRGASSKGFVEIRDGVADGIKKRCNWFELSSGTGEMHSPDKSYIFVKSDYKLKQIPLDKVLYIEGLKDYVKIYLEDEPHPILSLLSLKSLEEMLPDSRFIRVHRSFIVQGCKIKMIDRNRIVFGKEYIPISDTYKDSFAEFISRHTPLSNK